MNLLEKERLTCKLLVEFYNLVREKREFVDAAGRTTVRYWYAARRYVEERINGKNDGLADSMKVG